MMKPHFVEIKDFETKRSITVDMEGPYHKKNEKIGEHIYGETILIDGVPYHFEKYIPAKEELKKFKEENEDMPKYSKSGHLHRLVLFVK